MSDPAIDAARRDAESALPPGWKLDRSDLERYRAGRHRVDTYSASAVGPSGEVALAVGLTEAAAYGALARRLRGELQEANEWAPPVPPG